MLQKENVLVIESKLVDQFVRQSGYNHGGLVPIEYERFLSLLQSGRFIKREVAEQDPDYRQVIPYFVLTNAGNFFMMRRLNGAGEQRLHNLIGCFGGHINDTDSEKKDPVEAFEAGTWREFYEELDATVLVIDFLGLLVMDETPVDKVHLGAVFHMKVSNPRVKEVHKYEPVVFPIAQWLEYAGRMESWAKEASAAVFAQHFSKWVVSN
ncbi:MAG: hypothetical protein QXE80_03670 [Pyrobaculum sp.]